MKSGAFGLEATDDDVAEVVFVTNQQSHRKGSRPWAHYRDPQTRRTRTALAHRGGPVLPGDGNQRLEGHGRTGLELVQGKVRTVEQTHDVQAIIDRAGGRLAVESQPGKGTRFYICFPAEQAPHLRGPSPDVPVRVSRDTERTLLVVDDEKSTREVVVAMLRRRGYGIVEATSGDEAVRILREHSGQIDLVVTDVVMPGLTAKQFREELSQLRPATPILHISGYTDEQIGRQGILEDEIAFLHKPFTSEELAVKVEALLSKAAS